MAKYLYAGGKLSSRIKHEILDFKNAFYQSGDPYSQIDNCLNQYKTTLEKLATKFVEGACLT